MFPYPTKIRPSSYLRHLLPGLILSVAGLGASTAAPEGDWPEWRGPGGQGIAPVASAPLHWGPEKNIAWKTEIPGRGWSSPVIDDGKIFLTTAVAAGDDDDPNADRSLRALCLDSSNGTILWNQEVFAQPGATSPKIHKKNSHASPTPLLNGNRLYVHFGHQGTACLTTSGEIVWKNQDLTYPPVHGNGGSPALVGDHLIFSCDAARDPFVAALNKDDGSLAWKTPRNVKVSRTFSFSTPLAIVVGGKTQVVSPGSGAAIAYDPNTGTEIWRARYGEGYSVVPRPVFGHGLVYLSSGFDNASTLAIRPDGTGDVTDSHIVWSTDKRAPLTPSPLLVGDEIYTVSDQGIMTCADAKSGEVVWQERVVSNCSSCPTYAAGRIYIIDEQGLGAVVAAGRKFEILAKNKLEERCMASPAFVGDTLFIRTHPNLYSIRER